MTENIKDLMTRQAKPGKVEWIGRRPAKKADMHAVKVVTISTEYRGLEGDHYQGRSGQRDVTLIQAEHLDAVAKMLGVGVVDPGLTRRNIVVSGLNLLSLKEQKFSIGDDVVLEMTGLCHPCSRMEENLGVGGYNAMRGHGGITAKIVKGGSIRVGDEVSLLS